MKIFTKKRMLAIAAALIAVRGAAAVGSSPKANRSRPAARNTAQRGRHRRHHPDRHRHRHHQSGGAGQRRLAGLGHRGRAQGRLQRPREKGPGAAQARPDHLQRPGRPGRRQRRLGAAPTCSWPRPATSATSSWWRRTSSPAWRSTSRGARWTSPRQPAAGAGPARARAGGPEQQRDPLADRRRHHQAHHRPGPDRGGLVQHAEPVPDRAAT